MVLRRLCTVLCGRRSNFWLLRWGVIRHDDYGRVWSLRRGRSLNHPLHTFRLAFGVRKFCCGINLSDMFSNASVNLFDHDVAVGFNAGDLDSSVGNLFCLLLCFDSLTFGVLNLAFQLRPASRAVIPLAHLRLRFLCFARVAIALARTLGL